MKMSPAAVASFVEQHLQDTLPDLFHSMEPEPTRVVVLIRKDALVPGGFAISAAGTPMTEPTYDGGSEAKRRQEWLMSGDTGVSSKAIFAVLTGSKVTRTDNWPSDPSDFGRCYRLLERFPEWKDRMDEVAKALPAWHPLILYWNEIEMLYLNELKGTGGKGTTYAKMQVVTKECEKILHNFYTTRD